jgi:hypothetical protein
LALLKQQREIENLNEQLLLSRKTCDTNRIFVMSQTLTDQDFKNAATKLSCSEAAVRAVAEVMSSGIGKSSRGCRITG